MNRFLFFSVILCASVVNRFKSIADRPALGEVLGPATPHLPARGSRGDNQPHHPRLLNLPQKRVPNVTCEPKRPHSTTSRTVERLGHAHRAVLLLFLVPIAPGHGPPTRRRRISAATSCRSCRRTASPATGRTPRRARPTCGSTSRKARCGTTDPVIVPGKSGESELYRAGHQQRRRRGDAAAEIGQEADAASDRAPEEMDRPGGAAGASTGRSSRRDGRRRRRCKDAAGSGTRSTGSCWPGSRRRGSPRRRRPSGPR